MLQKHNTEFYETCFQQKAEMLQGSNTKLYNTLCIKTVDKTDLCQISAVQLSFILRNFHVDGLQVWHHCSMLVAWIVMAEDQRREHWRPREPNEKSLTCRRQTSVAVQMSVSHLLHIDNSFTACCVQDRLLILMLLAHPRWHLHGRTIPVHRNRT